MKGIFFWDTGEMTAPGALLPEMPPEWGKDLEPLSPWHPVSLLPDQGKRRLWISEKNRDIPATFITGTCDSVMPLGWYFHEKRLLPPWGSVLAARQMRGMGQLGRSWESPPGNLYMVLCLPDHTGKSPLPPSLLVGEMVLQTLRAMEIPAELKWPNDILIQGKKAGGILIQERSRVLLAGIGINLVSAPNRQRSILSLPAASLADIGIAVSPMSIWHNITSTGRLHMEEAIASSPLLFLQRLKQHLAFLGQEVIIDNHTEPPYHATLLDLSPSGELEVMIGSITKTIRSGSILPVR